MEAAPETAADVGGDVVLVGLSGSLREASTNTALLRTAQEEAPPGVQVILVPLHDIPLYNRDVEAVGYPPPVAALREAIERADGLLLASPEYNWSTSGVLKNAIDWASRGRPAPLDHKPTALMTAVGGSGGSRVQRHLREILGHNAVDVIREQVLLRNARDHVVDGRLLTHRHREVVRRVVVALVERVHALRRGEHAA